MTATPQLTEEQRKLSVEIFEKTGLKVDIGDPIIAVAMYHSATIRAAADHSSQALADAVSNAEKKFATMLQLSIEQTEARQTKASMAMISEFRDLLYMAPKDFADSKSADNKTTPVNSKIKTGPLKPILLLVLVATSAFLSGILWSRPSEWDETTKFVLWGRAVVAAYPQLDDSSKKKISEQIKKDGKSTHQ